MATQLSKVGQQTHLLSKYFRPMTFEDRLGLLKRAHAIDEKNDAVVLEIGELLRKQGWNADENGEALIRESMPWFENGIRLNRWNPYNYMNLGMCHHWLKEHEKATEYFEKAITLDPKGYYMLAMYGWHKLQLGELEAAEKHLKDSITFGWNVENPIAKSYLEIVQRRLAEQAVSR